MDALRTDDGAFATPVGQLVASATAETLLSPDWGLIMEVVDLIAAPECAQDAVRALEARLQSANPKVLMLTLTLLEAVVKNGSGGVHALLREHGVVESLGALTNEGQPGGEEVKGAAQELLQLVAATATATASASASPATFVPIQSAAAAAAAAGLGVTPEDAIAAGMAKLEQDLGAVEARVQQLLGLLPTAGPIEEDEALAEVVGFLESCQPRLDEVIEAGMEGALNEALLERALILHDELVKALGKEKEKENEQERTATEARSVGSGATNDLIDLGENSKPPAPPTTTTTTAAAAATPSDVFDLFGPSQGGPASGSQQPPTTAADSAVLAEADRLLQGLDLGGQQPPPAPQQTEAEEGESKTTTAM